ncbi:beta strand repeat-containing protein [Terrabacter terrigena]|uniref:alpha-amylase n=1 Tax=Terrabacter terrigena TaxID=574718 RepID=A0ABW3MV99_9MICO
MSLRALPSDRSPVRHRILVLFAVIALLAGQGMVSSAQALAATTGAPTMTVPAAGAPTTGAAASGQVTAADGSGPVAGVVVKALPHGAAGFTPAATATTGSTGAWSMTDLPPGDYDLQFDASDTAYLSQWWSSATSRADASIISAAAGGTLPGLNASLTRGATVSGRVVDEAGKSLPDVLVTPRERTAGDVTGSAVATAADGTFTVRSLAAGTYTLTFRAAGRVAWSYGMKADTDAPTYFPVAEGAAVTGRAMVLPAGTAPTSRSLLAVADTTAAMSGHVYAGSTTTPMVGALVVAVAADSDPLSTGTLNATTDDSGAWSLAGLPADVYTIHVIPPVASAFIEGWWDGAQARSHAAYVVLTAGSSSAGMDATLVRAGSISGQANAGGTAGIADVVVQAAPVGTDTWSSVSTDVDGNYTLAGLAPGAYDVQFDGQSLGYQTTWWSGSSTTGVPTSDAATPVIVAAGAAVTGRDVTMAQAGSIIGTVTDNTGAPVADATVDVWSTDPNVTDTALATTDIGGNFDTMGLPGGSYVVRVTPPAATGLATAFYDNAFSPVTATGFVVVDGVAGRADFSLVPGGSISGRVLLPNGTADPGTASLMVSPASDPAFRDLYPINPDGTFTVSGLGPGSYLLSAVDSNTLVTWWGSATSSPTNSAAASPVTLAAGATVSGLSIRLAAGASISGRVTEGTTTATAGQVSVIDVRTGAQLGTADLSAGSTWTVTGVPSGTYAVMATGSTGATRWFGNTTTWADSTFVVISGATARTGVDITLPAAGPAPGPTSVVSGHVTLPADATSGLDSLSIWLEDAAGNPYSAFSINPDGTFEILDVPSGSLTLHLRDFSEQLVLAPQTLTAPTTTVLEVQPVVGASVAGTLLNDAGKPLADVDVTAWDGSGVVASTLSGADGTFRLGGLSAGQVRLHVTPTSPYAATWVGGSQTAGSGTLFTLTLGQTTPVPDTTVPLGGTIAGTVTVPAGAQGTEVTVEALDAADRVVGSASVVGTHGYQLGGLLPGTVRVRFSAAGLVPKLWSGPGASSPSDVTVAAGQTVADVDATLSPPPTGTASVAGTVTAQGNPAARAKITLVRTTDGVAAASATTDAAGHYAVTDLPAGSYRVQVQDCLTNASAVAGPLCVTRWWPANDAATAQAVTVADAASLTGIDVELSTLLRFTAAPTPTITGTATVGLRLTAAPGAWGPSPVTLAYQWRRNGTAIPGAASSSYVLTASDRTTRITVTVTGTKSGYISVARTSAATAAVATGSLTAAPVPTITGTAKVGVRLTATAGTWSPAPVTLKYQWRRNGVAITGATASTYLLAASDRTARITVTVTGSKTGYTTAVRTSAATLAVAYGTLTAAPVPRITGTTRVGSRLTVTAGTWSPAPVTLKYQWRRNGVAITGATGSTYLLGTSMRGARITVTVTGSKTAYTSVARTSAATAAIS